ncbi:2OG-Fe(II) oxygenase [Pendulispora albinea]|uniref:2OG-Fe(II) oxygenase n=1 Tax=Pendulispora albinea TaxID=2741071 RepID=A0ABZ2MB63_9BACT
MRQVVENQQFAIYDDFLPPEEQKVFWEYLENADFRQVHVPTVKGAYRIEDGDILLGPQLIWPLVPVEAYLPNWKQLKMPPGYHICPTDTPADDLLARIRAVAGEHPSLIGAEMEQWIGIIGQPQINPAGSGISWHRDRRTYAGAFVYYAHPEWNSQWGGELLIAEPGTADGFHDVPRAHTFDNSLESKSLLHTGMGTYIAPKPNRLVLLAGKDPHSVAKVTQSAGHRVRVGFAGFFIHPTYVGDLLKRFQRHNDL